MTELAVASFFLFFFFLLSCHEAPCLWKWRGLSGRWYRMSTLCLNMSVFFVGFYASVYRGRGQWGGRGNVEIAGRTRCERLGSWDIEPQQQSPDVADNGWGK